MPAFLLSNVILLAAGGILHLTGHGGVGDVAWGITGAVEAGWSATLVIGALRAGRVGVDAIAVMAIVGVLLVSELMQQR